MLKYCTLTNLRFIRLFYRAKKVSQATFHWGFPQGDEVSLDQAYKTKNATMSTSNIWWFKTSSVIVGISFMVPWVVPNSSAWCIASKSSPMEQWIGNHGLTDWSATCPSEMRGFFGQNCQRLDNWQSKNKVADDLVEEKRTRCTHESETVIFSLAIKPSFKTYQPPKKRPQTIASWILRSRKSRMTRMILRAWNTSLTFS